MKTMTTLLTAFASGVAFAATPDLPGPVTDEDYYFDAQPAADKVAHARAAARL